MKLTEFLPLTRASLVLLVAVAALAGCREENQGQVHRWEPGVYKGKSEPALSEEALRELRARAVKQSGTIKSTGGASAAATSVATSGTDVRPPANTPAPKETYNLN